MASTTNSPTRSQLGGSACAGLGAVKVTVASARAVSPTGSAESPAMPEGISTATTRACGNAELISRIPSSMRPAAGPAMPVPSRASSTRVAWRARSGNGGQDRASRRGQHAEIGGRVALQLLGSGQQNHVERQRPEAGVKLARDRQPVAAVVALAAQHHDPLRRERSETPVEKLHHAVAGILHQDDAGDAQFDGAPIHLAHPVHSQYFHK